MKRQNFINIAFGLTLGLFIFSALWLSTRKPVGKPVSLNPPPGPAPLKIHISGAVVQPGVYELSPTSRIQDAIDAAGGLLPEADDSALNLAGLLEDGTHIIVPSKQPTALPSSGKSAAPNAPAATPDEDSPAPVGLININTATIEELDLLPGIGPKIAQRIVDYRTTNGLFSTIEALQEVDGIGPAVFEKLKDKVTVGS